MARIPEPEVTHLGMQSGEWPIYAFTGEEHATAWAIDRAPDGRTRYVWEVEEMRLGPPMRGEKVTTTRLREVTA